MHFWIPIFYAAARPVGYYIGRRQAVPSVADSRQSRLEASGQDLTSAFMHKLDDISTFVDNTTELTSLVYADLLGRTAMSVACADRCLAAPRCRYFEILCRTVYSVCEYLVCRFRG